VQACAANASGVCLGTPAPRAFVVNGVAGSIALPAVFTLGMLSSGDLDAPSVPVVITLGGAPVSVPFALTTGFALVDATPILGAPFDASGAVRLVGTGSRAALPSPLGGTPLALELACVHAGADLDQFGPRRASRIRSAITAKKVKITMTLEASSACRWTRPACRRSCGCRTRRHRAAPAGDAAAIRAARAIRRERRQLKITPGKGGACGRRRSSQGIAGSDGRARGGSGTMAIETGGLMARRSVKLTANGKGSRLAVREQ
jgi:hypothetical protein